MDFEFDDALVARVTELCDAGDDDVENGRFLEAIEKYQAALALVPTPREAFRVTLWIFCAMGEAFLFAGDAEAARRALFEAMKVPGASASPFVHLRLGQAELALGNERGARDELTRAYLGGGSAVFEGEDPDLLELALANVPESQRWPRA